MRQYLVGLWVVSLLLLSATDAVAHEEHVGHEHNTQSIGIPGDKGRITRTIDIDMAEMKFTPAKVTVKVGDTIRFMVRNSGQLKHEFVLGSASDLKAHYDRMLKFPEMEHSDPNMVSLNPDQTGDVIWKFTKVGRVNYGCLQPGHFDASMKGVVVVRGK
jgi:uncharacterized cupredoxin-like copper-binding protein